MLPRLQIKNQLVRARAMTDALEEQLARVETTRASQREAFSLGSGDVRRLRQAVDEAEDLAQESRVQLEALLAELSHTASDCRDEYRNDLAGAGASADAVVLPEHRQGCRIEEYRSWFEAVEHTVDDLVSKIETFRRQQLKKEIQGLRKLIGEAQELNADPAALTDFLDSEAWLDLDLETARRRLNEEASVVVETIDEARRKLEESARQARFESARQVVEQALDPSVSAPKGSDIAAALEVLRDGEDSRIAWRAVGAALKRAGTRPDDALTALVVDALEEELAGRDALPWSTVVAGAENVMPPAIDEAIVGNAAHIHRLSVAVFEDGTAPAIPPALMHLKRHLPCTARRILDPRLDELEIRDLAGWLASGFDHVRDKHAMGHLGRRLLETGDWARAWCILAPEEDASDRARAALWIALVEHPGAEPASADAWWNLLSGGDGFADSPLCAAVAAAASLWLGEAFPMSPDVADTAIPLLEDRDPLKGALTLCSALRRWKNRQQGGSQDLERRREELRSEVQGLLSNPKDPGGGPARVFYRQTFLPHLQAVHKAGGLGALAALSDDTVDDLLAKKRQLALNPVAIRNLEKRLNELRDAAAELVDLETRLADLPSEEQRLAETRKLARAAGESGAVGDPLWAWVSRRSIDMLEGRSRRVVEGSERFTVSNLVPLLLRDVPRAVLLSDVANDPIALRDVVLERLAQGEDAVEWQIRSALDLEGFVLAEEYLSRTDESRSPKLKALVDAAREAALQRRRADATLVSEMLATLEPSKDCDDIAAELKAALAAADQGDLADADGHIRFATELFESAERSQRDARERMQQRVTEALNQALVHLLQDGRRADDVSWMTHIVINQARDRKISRLEPVVSMLEETLAGGTPDLRSLRAMFPEPALHPGRESAPQGPSQEPDLRVVERMPARIEDLPRFVRRSIEDLLGMKEPPGGAGPQKMDAVVAAFRACWNEGSGWEAPLVDLLGQRGAAALREGRFLPAAEHYLAQARVAYQAAFRLDGGLAPARCATLNVARARFAQLRGGNGLPGTNVLPAHHPTTRDWISTLRDFLVLRGGSDLTDTLAQLFGAAPELVTGMMDVALV
ncbi:MAG TPA: hypothetical protein PK313_01015, partial [Myxococcota bacterium]|nr:hypothetical protein [Myxococcota bacterium]